MFVKGFLWIFIHYYECILNLTRYTQVHYFPQYFSRKVCFINQDQFCNIEGFQEYCNKLIWIHSSLGNTEHITNFLQVKKTIHQQTLNSVFQHTASSYNSRKLQLHLYFELAFQNITQTLSGKGHHPCLCQPWLSSSEPRAIQKGLTHRVLSAMCPQPWKTKVLPEERAACRKCL